MKRVALATLPLVLLTACGGGTSTKTVTKTVSAPASTVTAAAPDSSSPVDSPSSDDVSIPGGLPSDNGVDSSATDSGSGGGELDAAKSAARNYLDTAPFSKQGLIEQLSSSYGDKYPLATATQAVNSLTDVDWNAQAAKAAQNYVNQQSFSCAGLKDQLSSSYGDKYTASQAEYGANQTSVCK